MKKNSMVLARGDVKCKEDSYEDRCNKILREYHINGNEFQLSEICLKLFPFEYKVNPRTPNQILSNRAMEQSVRLSFWRLGEKYLVLKEANGLSPAKSYIIVSVGNKEYKFSSNQVAKTQKIGGGAGRLSSTIRKLMRRHEAYSGDIKNPHYREVLAPVGIVGNRLLGKKTMLPLEKAKELELALIKKDALKKLNL